VSDLGFDFFEKPEEIKKKALVECSYCNEKVESLREHYKSCDGYKAHQKELQEERKKKQATLDKFDNKIQEQLDNQEKKIKELTQMILDAREQVISKESPVVDKIKDLFVEFDFDKLVDHISTENDLKKFDKVVDHGNTFFYYMDYIKAEKEITESKSKYDVARFLNRVARGDSKMYKLIFNWVKDRILSIIKDTTEV